jgi:hypothetical protein
MGLRGAGLESSGIGVSLQKRVTVLWNPLCFGLLVLLPARPTEALLAQAPSPTTVRPSSLPRFTLREIIAGRNDSLLRIPGPWIRAATMVAPESLAMLAYTAAASRSGVTPLGGSALAAQRSQHVMGLFRRPELVMAARRTLESIRAAIPSDSTRARFDRIFRSRGAWVTDLHDAALASAQTRTLKLGWDSARRALTAAGWVPGGDTAALTEAVPRALYGLRVLAANDSVASAAAQTELVRADSISAEAVTLLLNGYAEGQRWYAEAVEFFLNEPWIPDGRRGRSIGDLVRDDWLAVRAADPASPIVTPEIKAWLFGYPQAVPHYSVPPALFDRLVSADNVEAHLWLRHQGPAALLRALRRLPAGDTTLALLQVGRETVRLSTVPRHARESLNGFLEPRDVIAIDPGYSPLLALGAVVHEWQHLAFRRLQLEEFAARLPQHAISSVSLPGVQPYVAEGFAEWSAERILEPVISRWPLLGLGELEKRAGLARESVRDEHTLGYALVRQLAAVLKDPATTTRMLLRYVEDPSGIATEPAIRAAWRRYRRAPDYVFAAPMRRVLIPEVTFTLEDGFPDVISTRILVPPTEQPTR